jgi:hypothetical protein
MCFCFAAFFEPDEIHYPAIDIAMNETSICSSFPIIYIGQKVVVREVSLGSVRVVSRTKGAARKEKGNCSLTV